MRLGMTYCFLAIRTRGASRHRRSRNRVRCESVERLEARKVLTAGALDTSFGTAGLQTISFPSGSVDVADVALDSAGRIVIAGTSNGDFALARYLSTGALDVSFGDEGVVTTDFGLDAEATALALQSDGKVVVVGSTGGDFAVARYNTDGTIDVSFDADGKLATDVGGSRDKARDLVIQSDGRILAAGDRASLNQGHYIESDFALVRYNPDGSVDSAFGNQGIVTTHLQTYNYVAGVGLQNDGRIVVGGDFSDGQGDYRTNFVVIRYLSNGSLDPAFGGGGIAHPGSISSFGAFANGIGIQADGKIVEWGSAQRLSGGFLTSYPVVSRFQTNGDLDPTFGVSGLLRRTEFDSGSGRAVALQSDGRFVLAGVGNVYRFNSDGSPDTTFDGDGKVDLKYNGTSSFSLSMLVVDEIHRIVGVTANQNVFGLVRLDGDPGVVITPPSKLRTSEAGGTSTFTINLLSAPTENVTISLASSDTAEGTVSPSSLIFTPANFRTPQAVTVTGVDDSLTDGDKTFTIVSAAAVSADMSYDGFDPDDVRVTNADNDTQRMYRAYNPNADYHFFTTSQSEFDNAVAHGYRDETTGKAGFLVLPDAVAGATPIYRLYNLLTGRHYYTYSSAERDSLVAIVPAPASGPDTRKVGWRYEKDEGFIYTSPSTGTVEIFRLYNVNTGVHLYTENAAYKDAILNQFSGIWLQHSSFGFALASSASSAVATAPLSALEPSVVGIVEASNEADLAMGLRDARNLDLAFITWNDDLLPRITPRRLGA